MKNNSKFKRNLIVMALVLFLSFPLAAGAYSKPYEFNITQMIQGKTKHSLANKTTYADGSGNTYDIDNKVMLQKSSFKVYLNRFLKSYSITDTSANGRYFSKSFGTVTKNDYTVTVTKTKKLGYGERVRGGGNIKQ